MDHSFDISDSTDWLNTPLSLVAPLESALRCQVCKDFFDNPVITSCCHTFCSLCIRRCLSSEGKCPACRSSDQELKLRRNWAVQELVDSFKNARLNMLSLARERIAATQVDGKDDIDQPAAKKRRLAHPDEPSAVQPDGRRTRSQGRRIESQALTPDVEVIEDSEDDDFVPDDGLVACPMCNRRMKNEVVFNHLDVCRGSQMPLETLQSAGPLHLPLVGTRNQPRNQAKPPARLPFLNYSILKEGVFRKKLRDLGIPDWGPRPLLQRRHTEWMNLWNANCDAKVPKSKKELLRELFTWERTQGGMAPTNNPVSLSGSNSVMRKDFDATAWSTSHDDDFKKLIQNARKKADATVRPTVPQPLAGQPSEGSRIERSNETAVPPAYPGDTTEADQAMKEQISLPSAQQSNQNRILDTPVA